MTKPRCRVCKTEMLTDSMTEPEELAQGRDLCAAWRCPVAGCRTRFVERVERQKPPPDSRGPEAWGVER